MKRIHKTERYVYDPLYGIIYLPEFIWDIISCAELQRLREVRLCNINSFCLTGGANINRYEHAIGTCYLAQACLDSWPPLSPISENEQRLFLLSALLHDVASAAFGHSIEYIESKKGFDHERAFEYVALGEKGETYQYKHATLEPIFFGMRGELSSKISKDDLKEIAKIIAGKGRFGSLINGTIDLDNIDNVFRLAYHIGIVKSGEVPLKLAKSLWIKDNELIIRADAISFIEEWHKVRKKLYLLLLLNPEEFSAKCMLSEAIELSIMERYLFSWDEIPGNDSDKFIEFLRQNFSVNWAKSAKIDKSNDKTINVSSENNFLSLKLNNEKTKTILTIDESRTDEFITKMENGKLNIYTERFNPFNWYDVDYEFLKKLSGMSSEISQALSRLMMGDLYGCIGIFSTSKTDKYQTIFSNLTEKIKLEEELTRIIQGFLFTWGSISEIDRKILVRFLKEKLDINFTENSTILKSDDDKTVRIVSNENSVEIIILLEDKENKKKAILKTSDGRSFDLQIKEVYGKLEIYRQSNYFSRFKSAMVALHSIIDINKTERQVCIRTDNGQVVKIGNSSKQLLIGVFFKNVDLNMYKIDNIPANVMNEIRQEVYKYLSDILEDQNLKEVELYDEIEVCK